MAIHFTSCYEFCLVFKCYSDLFSSRKCLLWKGRGSHCIQKLTTWSRQHTDVTRSGTQQMSARLPGDQWLAVPFQLCGLCKYVFEPPVFLSRVEGRLVSWLRDVASNLLEQKVGMGDRHRFFWWIKKKQKHTQQKTNRK